MRRLYNEEVFDYPLNFWDYGNPYEELYPDFYSHFAWGVLPEPNSVQTIRYIMTSGPPVEHQFRITDTAPMPTVAATKTIEDGLKLTFRCKEIKSGLKITWNDPKFQDIQKPGIQLRVAVTAINHEVDEYMTGDTPANHETFLWIDTPAQMHKMLIPTETWNLFKNRLIAQGFSEARIIIVYRTIEYDENFQTEYKNRGYSEAITIPLN